MTEYRFTIHVPGSNAKGSMYEAQAETTLTGVKWTLRGELAKGVQSLIVKSAQQGKTIQSAYDAEHEADLRMAETAQRNRESEAGHLSEIKWELGQRMSNT